VTQPRVVVTGLGIVSCLGNEPGAVSRALREGRSGVRFNDSYQQAGLRCHVAGLPSLKGEPPIERKARRFMGETAIYAHHALRKAMADAKLASKQVSSPRTGLIVGSGVGSLSSYVPAIEGLRKGGLKKLPPYTVLQTMSSAVSAALATAFGVRGHSYSMSSACASSAHAIGHAAELIRMGKQDLVLAGGADEAEWTTAGPFDAMGALSTAFNDRPEAASRPYDAARDGFVLAGGAGMLVLESLEHAKARGARVYAELAGYGASSGGDMVTPSSEAAADSMRLALADAGTKSVDYINTHATSTAADVSELAAIRAVLGDKLPPISSTKGLTGHALGASGAHEAIYSLLMMRDGFIAACANLEEPDPAAAGFPLVTKPLKRNISSFLSNSLGFGGTNASLVFRVL
jgi:3-oxoacyl-[acyl-carrier-protein] synthase-1